MSRGLSHLVFLLLVLGCDVPGVEREGSFERGWFASNRWAREWFEAHGYADCGDAMPFADEGPIGDPEDPFWGRGDVELRDKHSNDGSAQPHPRSLPHGEPNRPTGAAWGSAMNEFCIAQMSPAWSDREAMQWVQGCRLGAAYAIASRELGPEEIAELEEAAARWRQVTAGGRP